ncbi:MAG: YcjF family protein [Chthoniobacterales bacterium]
MNNSALLHIVERLEGLVNKLPDTIRKPVLSELTPLKELFLQQRPPRFVLTGPHPMPLLEFVARIFAPDAGEAPSRETLTGLFRWQKVALGQHASIQVLDARGADEAALRLVGEALRQQPADIFFFLPAEREAKAMTRKEIERLERLLGWNGDGSVGAKLIELQTSDAPSLLRQETGSPAICASLVGVFSLGPAVRRVLASELPNEARVELVRSGGDRHAQAEIAEMLVKSTSAICAAVGAQPIPLADLPILTTLQLVMVSGIMYISGRERSLRASTEFVGALGANVGLGMLFREGTRAVLKFFPGWGNVVCGMVAGAGTFAIGRAAMVYFVEGATLRDARRAFVENKKKRLPLPGRKRKALTDSGTKR